MILSRTKSAFALLPLLLLWVNANAHAVVTFEDLLKESALEFLDPPDFDAVELKSNDVLPYEKAHQLSDGSLEIRYAIRPLSRVQIEYEDPHSSAPDPNHLFPLIFQSLVEDLAANRNSPTREYPIQQAQEQFNADWAAAATFDVVDAFSDRYRQALLLAIHKNHKADAYVIFLFDDYSSVKSQIKRNMTNLRFR